MNPKPLKRCRIPAYPTKLQILSEPRLLERNLPAAWKTGLMASAVSVFLAANALGCASPSRAEQEPPAESQVDERDELKDKFPGSKWVAPIFEHGDGRAVDGCVVVSPPVFLSEEEAMRVIAEEMKKHGVTLSARNTPWDVMIPPPDFGSPALCFQNESQYEKLLKFMAAKKSRGDMDKAWEEYKEAEPLCLDGLDQEHKVAVEFVSHRQYPWPYIGSSVGEYRLKHSANALAKYVSERSKKEVYFGTFYDPGNNFPRRSLAGDLIEKGLEEEEIKKILKQKHEDARQESLKLLREQVRDFVDWLKAQGAI